MMKVAQRVEAEKFLTDLLVGMIFCGFRFRMFFELDFYGEHDPEATTIFPGEVKIHLSEWWFGERSVWEKKVLNLGGGWQAEERLQAASLTELRWSEKSKISNVAFDTDLVIIEFENGRKITSREAKEGDEYFIVVDENKLSEVCETWFSADNSGVYIKNKKKGQVKDTGKDSK